MAALSAILVACDDHPFVEAPGAVPQHAAVCDEYAQRLKTDAVGAALSGLPDGSNAWMFICNWLELWPDQQKHGAQ